MSPRAKVPKCSKCGGSMPQERLVLSGRYVCADCAYLADHPDAPRITKPSKPKVPQSERMF